MEEPLNIFSSQDNRRSDFERIDELKMLVGCDTRLLSPVKVSSNLNMDSSDEDGPPVQKTKKRIKRFAHSDSDTDEGNANDNKMVTDNSSKTDSKEDNIYSKSKSKTRIQLNMDSDSELEAKVFKNEEQQMRMKNKRNKLKQRFQDLLKSREKHDVSEKSAAVDEEYGDTVLSSDHQSSDNIVSSVKTIKQKIKESMSLIPSICDPDTSDEEDSLNNKQKHKQTQKKGGRSTKATSPKPMRMSAKQAMENMHKIKSESNRMLREKEVSLPYHRPKALSLKDIMSRRKPAVTSDGKALPIKMNEEQLRQYALQLEQRQKEMMELCKSDTEEEESLETENKTEATQKENPADNTETLDLSNSGQQVEDRPLDDTNDETFDEINEMGDEETITKSNLATMPHDTSEVTEVIEAETNRHEIEVKVSDGNASHESVDDMKLVYNDSIEDAMIGSNTENVIEYAQSKTDYGENLEHKNLTENNSKQTIPQVCTESESQLISLHFDTEKTHKRENPEDINNSKELNVVNILPSEHSEKTDVSEQSNEDFLSDDDINMDDIDKLIENAEIMKNTDDPADSSMLIQESTLNIKPKLTGAPGMVIDLNGTNPIASKKLSGVELLKERFTYYAKLKTPEELEREREKKSKPGAQHLKLKQELEEKIAEQRSLEWAKRLEEEKKQHMEMDAIRCDGSDADDDIEKMEAKLEEIEKESSESEEELVEDDIELKDKPRKRNPMLDDEAAESDCDEVENNKADVNDIEGHDNNEGDDIDDDNDEESEDSSDDVSSESEDETTKPKKGRILKAFEDSDDEDVEGDPDNKPVENKSECINDHVFSSQATNSQDDDIQLAQRHKSTSDDIFASLENASSNKDTPTEIDLGTQTFSILDSIKPDELESPDKIFLLDSSQPYHDPNIDALASGLTQRALNSQLPETQSQPIGEDVLALCTGQFYDNEFLSQTDDKYDKMSQGEYSNDSLDNDESIVNNPVDISNADNPVSDSRKSLDDNVARVVDLASDKLEVNGNANVNTKSAENNKNAAEDGNLLKSILDELDDPEFDKPKPNKFFNGSTQRKEHELLESTQMRKKFIIDSDDETEDSEKPKKKKLKKKKKPEKRALHISDDEEEEVDDEEEYVSDIEEEAEKEVEYDSEENEIEVKPQQPKKKRKGTDFFEQEAELTSEDEWVGSGDEDEAGLDRMEREAGDDDVFHQGQLRNELGQIHMRDVLDQDKREVRLLQELLFEDGDLGGGHRQRKFRWQNADGDEETGTMVDEFGDTQEDEFESEEQWRKQRHEREVFLRQMQKQDDEEDLNISINRTTIIKANLSSRTMSSLLTDANQVNKSETEATGSPFVNEKKTTKDIPSPKKSFFMFQQNYHGSLLTRGQGALARLAALATPLVTDDDAPKIGSLLPTSRRNFVFAALTPDEKPKATTKRKADTNIGTPKLMKKMKIDEKKNNTKTSLSDHLS